MFKLLSVLALASSVALSAPIQARGSGTASKSRPLRFAWSPRLILVFTPAYYSQNGNAGSCGSTHSDSDYIVALGSSNDPSGNCGKSVKITSGSGSITATVADTCVSSFHSSWNKSIKRMILT